MYSEVIDTVILPSEAIQEHYMLKRQVMGAQVKQARHQQAQVEPGHICTDAEVRETRERLSYMAFLDGKGEWGADDCTQQACLRALEAGERGEAISCLCRFATLMFPRVKIDDGRRKGAAQRTGKRYAAHLGHTDDAVCLGPEITARRRTPGLSPSMLAWQVLGQMFEEEALEWQSGRYLRAFMDAVYLMQATSRRVYTKEVIAEVMAGKTGGVERQRRSQELAALRADLTEVLQRHPDFAAIKTYARSLEKHADISE
jgi:hypothetical protein